MKYCDLTCEHARWPDKLADGSKTCRTFIALYCEKLDMLVDKNGTCKVDWDKDDEGESSDQ
ncbi:MAG: hypothetical protein HN356_02870 [Calditrichaeota bacterium]|nr:hypothetical protein [Calditrichota bacterium]MBT7618095.1 hypothetical protein [Calditrichota bacterium]